ncbi:MAG: hypothetical protein ABJL54_02600 [Halioglobus sp.]
MDDNHRVELYRKPESEPHLPDKSALERLLDEIMLTLKPNGRYLIMEPNLRCLPGEYWDFYDHHPVLTHASLYKSSSIKAFQIERCVDCFLSYKTQGALPTHPSMVRTYLSFLLAWKFLGKQFLIVAGKSR